ncbi:MAG TPA: hypothetical protein VI485_28295 [Vicinamibacterales bacterium]|nr:hypothetical protein [Vicinamibacterales bacterium]
MSKTLFACALPILAHLLVASPAGAATVGATGCSSSAVQSAINSASNGDTVRVPAGTCTWTTAVSIPNSKSLVLEGAGIGQTTIRDGVTTDAMLVLNVRDPYFIRITAFTFDLNQVSKSNSRGSVRVLGNGLDNFRIDHIRFTNITGRAIGIDPNGAEISGLIDHNTFECPTDGGCQSVTVTGDGPQESAHMGRPYEPGSNKFVFVEDNTFNYSYQNDGGVEGYGGARFVLRFNAMHGVTQGSHGADSGNYRGTHSFEIYRNTFDLDTWVISSTSPRSITHRSGTGFVFDNSVSSEYGFYHLRNYRSEGSYGVWGECDGTSPWDGNESGKQGYPCLDQIGHVFTDVLNGTNLLAPLYTWGNTKGNGQLNAEPSGGTRLKTLHVLENRDYYNQDMTFDGTTGVGVGPFASRSTTCTRGVGYWATDRGSWNASGADGQFFKCTSTNTWTLNYTPYTYPHPLTTFVPTSSSSSGPSSPANLRIVP